MAFLGSSAGKQSACSVGDLSLFPRLARSPRWGNGYPLQYSGLENGQRGLAGYSPWGRKELDTTEQLPLSLFHFMSEFQVCTFWPPSLFTAPDCASGIQCFAFFKSLQVNEIIQCLSLSVSDLFHLALWPHLHVVANGKFFCL